MKINPVLIAKAIADETRQTIWRDDVYKVVCSAKITASEPP